MLTSDRFVDFTVDMRKDRVAVITLERVEKLNGLTWPMKRDLTEALIQLSYDNDVDVIVITGGEHFSAGDAFGQSNEERNWHEAVSPALYRQRYDGLSNYTILRMLTQNLMRTLRAIDKVTIAAIDGFTIQSGMTLALCCDFRIATPRARIGSATLRMGFLPDEGALHLLTQMLGVPRTKDFLFRKRILSGTEALDWGLVHELAEPEALLDCAIALAREIAEGPQVATRLLKHAIDNAAEMTFEQAAIDIALRTAISDHHPDAKEGAAAFVAKPRRKPKFNVARGDA